MTICGYEINPITLPITLQMWVNVAVIAGLWFTVRQYKITLFSQKFQNAKTLVDSFYSSLEKGDIQAFENVIELRGEPAGGDNKGHYQDEQGNLQNFSSYFTEGATDGGRLDRIVNNLERVCHFANKKSINIEFFYSELGQFISICHEILLAMSIDYNESVKTEKAMSSNTSGSDNIDRCFEEMMKMEIPIKIIGYVE